MSTEERYAEARKLYDNDEYDKAVPLLETLAGEGHAGAQYCLGDSYWEGKGVEKDGVKSVELFHNAAENGDPNAQCRLGILYSRGKMVAEDKAKAIEWYIKAAEQGNAEAQISLGICYREGSGVAKDDAKSFEWIRKAAEQGDVDAQFMLGCCYYDGVGIAKDHTKAIEWYNKAAEHGDEDAKEMLAKIEKEAKKPTTSVKASEQKKEDATEKAVETKDGKKSSMGTGMSCLMFLQWGVLAAIGAVVLGRYGIGYGILGFFIGAIIGFFIIGIIAGKYEPEKKADSVPQSPSNEKNKMKKYTINQCTKEIEANPNNAEMYYNRGLAYLEKNLYEKAVADFSTAIGKGFDMADAYCKRGKAYSGLNRRDESIADVRTAIEKDNDCYEAWDHLRYHLKNEERYHLKDEEAIKCCTEMIRIKPDSADAYWKRGQIYYLLRDYSNAIPDMEKSLKLWPNGNPNDRKMLESAKVEAVYFKNPGIFGTNYGQEIRCLEGLTYYNYPTVEEWARLGFLYAEVMGNNVKALDCIEKVLERDALYPNARENFNIIMKRLSPDERRLWKGIRGI